MNTDSDLYNSIKISYDFKHQNELKGDGFLIESFSSQIQTKSSDMSSDIISNNTSDKSREPKQSSSPVNNRDEQLQTLNQSNSDHPNKQSSLSSSNSTTVSTKQEVPDICKDYTSYLKTITPDINKPFLVNVDVYQLDRILTFYLVINTMHLRTYMKEDHFNFSLLFNKNEYPNLNQRKNTDVGYIVIKFEVPVNSPYQEGQLIKFTLKDNKCFHKYENVKACVRYPNPNPLPLAICAYVSDYNSMDELRSWIAFYRIQKVSMIIFYVSVPMPELQTEFASLIASGFLRLVDFTWPRAIVGYPIQCSNQQSQMNSCFYHFKYEVQALIICDTDEYIYSYKFPSDLIATKNDLDTTTKNKQSVIHVENIIYYILYIIYRLRQIDSEIKKLIILYEMSI